MEDYDSKNRKVFDKSSYKDLIGLKYLPSWLAIACLAILAYIPNRLRDIFAISLAYLLYLIPTKARRVAYANLRTAFPDLSAKECRAISRRSTAVALCVALAYGETTFLPTFMLKRRWIVHGLEHFQKARDSGKPIIFLAPHNYAIDRCGLFLSYSGLNMCTMTKMQRNRVFDWFLNQQRLRFGGTVYPRTAGLRVLVRELKHNNSIYFLPDEDLGDKSARFINFFGVPKATVSSLPKLAKVGNAQVMQFFATYNIKKASFEIFFSPVFENYPGPDLDTNLKIMNESIEKMLVQHKEQFMWVLRIFKTVPDPSYPDIYANTYTSLYKKGKSIDVQGRRRPYCNTAQTDDEAV